MEHTNQSLGWLILHIRYLYSDPVACGHAALWEHGTGVTRSELDFISRVLRDRLRCQLPENWVLQGGSVQRGHWKLHSCGQSVGDNEKCYKFNRSTKIWRCFFIILSMFLNTLDDPIDRFRTICAIENSYNIVWL